MTAMCKLLLLAICMAFVAGRDLKTVVSCEDCARNAKLPGCAAILCMKPPSCADCARNAKLPGCAAILCLKPPSCADCARNAKLPGCAALSCPAPPSCADCARNAKLPGCAALSCPAPPSCADCARNAKLPGCALILCTPQATCESCARDATIPGCAAILCLPVCPCKPLPDAKPVCGISAAGKLKDYSSGCAAKCAKAVCQRKGHCDDIPPPPRPNPNAICTLIYAPVCGVRPGNPAKTYSNACFAEAAGVFCHAPGPCK